MSVANIHRQFRIWSAWLLVICLSETAATAPWLVGRENAGVGAKTVVFLPAAWSGPAFTSADEKRTRQSRFDDLINDAIRHEKSFVRFTRKSGSFLLENKAGATQITNRTATPTRAPPLFHSPFFVING
jgi:hypothetical protein